MVDGREGQTEQQETQGKIQSYGWCASAWWWSWPRCCSSAVGCPVARHMQCRTAPQWHMRSLPVRPSDTHNLTDKMTMPLLAAGHVAMRRHTCAVMVLLRATMQNDAAMRRAATQKRTEYGTRWNLQAVSGKVEQVHVNSTLLTQTLTDAVVACMPQRIHVCPCGNSYVARPCRTEYAVASSQSDKSASCAADAAAAASDMLLDSVAQCWAASCVLTGAGAAASAAASTAASAAAASPVVPVASAPNTTVQNLGGSNSTYQYGAVSLTMIVGPIAQK
jgi:hypothetical protein